MTPDTRPADPPTEAPEETLDPADWEAMRALGHRMMDDALDWLRDVRERPVWQRMPDDVRATFRTAVPRAPATPEAVYREFTERVLPYPMGNVHPRFWGWVMGTGTPMGVLADMLASTMNPKPGLRRIEGVLPLAEVKSLLFGHTLVSLPFCVYGGIAAESERARKRARRGSVVVGGKAARRPSGTAMLDFAANPEWLRKDLYVTFRKELDSDVEHNLLAIPRKQRAMVRKGIKAGLRSMLDEDVERFFAAYSASVHRLGTPVFSKRYFRILTGF